MQKKLIALAVAGLVSGAAFAQVAPNNVTLSGIVDMGYQYSNKSYVDGVKSQNAFNDGGQDGSRVKLDGVEDLGNGLKVGFHTDWRFSVDTRTGVTVDNQNLFLSGGFGTVTAGSFGSALDDINGYSEAGGMGWGNGVVGTHVAPDPFINAVKYNSPSFGGFDFMVGFSTNNQGGEVEARSDNPLTVADESAANYQAITARASYIAGPVKAGLAVIKTKAAGGGYTDRATEWLASGSYNFGPVILGAGYGRFSANDSGIAADIMNAADTVSLKRRTAWRVNVGAPIGANDAVALSYSRATQKYFDGLDSDKLSGWGLSYTHNMSKRTNIYASYGKLNQDDDNHVMSGVNGTYEQAFKVGLRHQF